jgi:hypothetical protein
MGQLWPQCRQGRASAGASIQSVDRALTLLETIAELGGETTLSKLASRTGLNISTCHHPLATLVQRGFVIKALGQRGYALGARILSQSRLPAGRPAAACAVGGRPYQPFGGETVHRAALQGDGLVTVLKREHATPCRSTAAPSAPPRSACHRGRQGDAGLAAGRRDPPIVMARHDRFTPIRSRFCRADGGVARCGAAASRSIARNSGPA